MKTQIVRIMDCAEVLPGFSTQGALRDDPSGTHQVVMGKHLIQGEPYIYKKEDRLRIVPVPEPTAAPSTFFILKPKPNVVPAYLVWCLEQPLVESYLSALRTGAGTPTIPRKGFMEITIPLADRATQHRIADLWHLQNRELRLRRQLLEESTRFQRLAGQGIFNELISK